MFEKLRQILGAQDPDRIIADDLETMMTLATELVLHAGRAFFGEALTDAEREAFYADDRRINRLEQKIRRQVLGRVVLSTPAHRTRLVAFVGLVKNAERLGDYAKNLLEAAELLADGAPPGAIPPELAQIRAGVEAILTQAHDVLCASDEARARALLDEGHALSQRCDALIASLVGSDRPAAMAVPAALATRYYKRIDKHLMNLLSSVVMPMDKMDYYEG